MASRSSPIRIRSSGPDTALTPPVIDRLLLGLIAFAAGHALCRKRLAAIGAGVSDLMPTRLRALLPTVQVVETETNGTTVDIRFGR